MSNAPASGGLGTVAGFALVAMAALLLRATLQADTLPLFGDADDAMHIVTATSLADGQAWFDTASHRENTPFGAGMHFSRLVDAPLAALILLFRPLLGANAGDLVVLVWPVLLIPLLLWLSLKLCRLLMPEADALPAVALPLLTLALVGEFVPGRVDHHNLQMLAVGGLVAGTILARRDWRGGILAGLCAAVSLAIGAETLHLVAVGFAIFGLYWVSDPLRFRRTVTAFAVSIAAGTVVLAFATLPLSSVFAKACDALSLSYLVAVLMASAAVLLATLLSPATRVIRLLLVGGLGAAAGVATLLVSPECLRGPYAALDPALVTAFLATVNDTGTILSSLRTMPVETWIIVIVPFLQLLLGLVIARRATGEARMNWLVLLAFLAAALAVGFLQLRGAKLGALLGIPVGVWLIDLARRNARGWLGAVKLAGAWFAFASLLHLGLLMALSAALPMTATARPITAEWLPRDTPPEVRARCSQRETFAELAALPPGRVMAQIWVASNVLYFTPHEVVGTGFHRNAEGLADNVRFFNGTADEAREIASRRGLDYVVWCRGQGYVPLPGTTPRTHDQLLAERPWLTRLSDPTAPLQILRITLP